MFIVIVVQYWLIWLFVPLPYNGRQQEGSLSLTLSLSLSLCSLFACLGVDKTSRFYFLSTTAERKTKATVLTRKESITYLPT